MLILTRKIGESVICSDGLKVTIKEIKGNTVKIGVEAPSNVFIYREEVYKKILDENKKAVEANKGVISKLFDFILKHNQKEGGNGNEL